MPLPALVGPWHQSCLAGYQQPILDPRQPGLTVLVATAYMEEASAFDYLVAMNEGQVLAADTPQGMIDATGQPTLEAAFISLLPETTVQRSEPLGPRAEPISEEAEKARPVAIEATQLTRYFGNFKAVDEVCSRCAGGFSSHWHRRGDQRF